jgi:hypothetical protein
MSWFRHKPPKHPPTPHHHLAPHHTSPTTERILKDTKEKVRPLEKPPTKKKKH